MNEENKKEDYSLTQKQIKYLQMQEKQKSFARNKASKKTNGTQEHLI